jgi:hypothetical protein
MNNSLRYTQYMIQLCKKKFQLVSEELAIESAVPTVTPDAVEVEPLTAKKSKQTKKQMEQQAEAERAAEEEKRREQEEREESSTEMREEVSALTAVIFKYLASTVPALRPVALSALLCITRAAVSTPNTDPHCRSSISSSLQIAFKEFTSKKNSRLNPKIFEELIQRFPDFCVASFLPDLISSCEGAKTSFLRSECCRFLGDILKRHKSLQAVTVETLDHSLMSIVTTLAGALSFNFSTSSSAVKDKEQDESADKPGKSKKNKKSKKGEAGATEESKEEVVTAAASSGKSSTGDEKEKEKGTRAKRLKPLLLCAKELANLLKTAPRATGGGKEESRAEALRTLLSCMRSEGVSSSSNSPAVVRMVDQVVHLLTASSNSAGGGAGAAVDKKIASATVENSLKDKSSGTREKKQKKVAREDKMVMAEGQAEQEDDDEEFPVGEYVAAGAKGPKFKSKKGTKKEAEADKQEILDVAEKQLIRRMNDDKRQRLETEETERDVEVEKKRKWHE